MRRFILLVVLVAWGGVAAAMQTDEGAGSEDVEARVNAVASALRCVQCKNQSIADSDAQLARNMVALVRERIVAGDTDEEVIAFFADRYGEYVLLRPKWSARNLGLWIGPLFLLVVGSVAAIVYIRGKRGIVAPVEALSQAERDELDRLLGKGPKDEI